MPEYVAFLRGINVGGNRKIPMAELRALCEELGLEGVRTLLNSGNVCFAAPTSHGLTDRLESALADRYGKRIGVILRKRAQLSAMVESHPFGLKPADNDTKYYVALLRNPDAHKLPQPCREPGDFEVIGTTPTDIYAVAHRLPNGRFGEGLDKAFKMFGETVTMRNWNTVIRLVKSKAQPE